ncbi:MAG TPA: ATP-binding protein [Spirochaetia bacterium]|nr:ATP-binding protein [Spirochaetia bacterium]
MQMVVINLIDNAIKASRPGGAIRLGYKDDAGRKCLYVADHGKGIPEAELERIFEPFYRIHKTRSPDEKGIGLGLAICREIVGLHGAELVMESRPDRGTKAVIMFPDKNSAESRLENGRSTGSGV